MSSDQLRASEIRGIILDYGEVLCHKPLPETFGRMAVALGLAPETFEARYGRERVRYDRGDLSAEAYWATVADGRHVVDAGLLAELRRWDVEMWSNLDEVMIEWMGQTRAAGIKVGLLSNMPLDMAEYARANFKWLRRMDALILSSELRLAKPERAIYERAVAELGVRPDEALFIDDREPNVEGAREAGLHGVRFEGVERLRDTLAAAGFAVLP
jgi:putative hydrolase of the HAD superfamily